jgi:hypothetical protein
VPISIKCAELRQIVGACRHQPKMGWLDMLATGFEAMVHRRRNACLAAAEAGLNAAGHLFGHATRILFETATAY